MGIIRNFTDSDSNKGFTFWCKGCGCAHKVYTIGVNVPVWQFNNNLEYPTFKPSILVRSGHFTPSHKGNCWCDYNKEHPENKIECALCHSYITNGSIQYLNDCTHNLKGKTIKLEEF